MLSIYGRKLRPHHEIEKIISATEGFEDKSLKKWQKISTDSEKRFLSTDDRERLVA